MICFLRRDVIEGLEKVGFKTNLGIDGSGIIEMVLQKGGGYYIGLSVPFSLSLYTDSYFGTFKTREQVNRSSMASSRLKVEVRYPNSPNMG
jgi:hypothetical protein